MKPLLAFPLSVAVLASWTTLAPVSPLAAQEAAGPTVDLKSMLSDLKTLKARHAESAKTQLNQTLQQLREAAATEPAALALYLDAKRSTLFAGANREQTQFQEWKKKEANRLNDHAFSRALQLHLSYLALSLQRARGDAVPQLLPDLIEYAKAVAAAPWETLNTDVMKQPVRQSVFATWLGLGPALDGLNDWDPVPGHLNEIWAKTILPQLRRDKDARLLEYWDLRLQQGADAASKSNKSFDLNQFEQVEKPNLLWSRAQELIVLGRRNEAATAMFAIIKNWPDHPKNAEWIAALEVFLNEKPL